MKTARLFGIALLFFSTFSFISCNNNNDNFGYRGFMHKATILGDSINGYHCYFDGGGLAVSYDQRLASIERGYFSFNYMESDWKIVDNAQWIDNAYVVPYNIYNVIRPISIEEADSKHIADKDKCAIPPLLSLGRGYRGYFDLNTALSVTNLPNLEKVPTEMNMVYDPAKQMPDTLRLQFYYSANVPETWLNSSLDYGSVSCDLSSLATLKQWSDSVTIVVEAGDEKKHWIKISKNDFHKPTIKRE